MSRAPSKATIDRWFASGDADETARRLAIGHLLMCAFVAYLDEADDILARHGLVYGELKYRAKLLNQAFDQYDRILTAMLDREAHLQLSYDYEPFKSLCDKIMNGTPVEDCEQEGGDK